MLGRYRVLEQIGAGAMGAVYRAEQVGLGRPVALKVLKKQRDAAGEVMARFEREARAMSALTHPNTVRVYDFGATREGQLFLAMELLEGELASTHLGARGPVRPSEAIVWAKQVLRSLGEAHAKGIIHRDVKPDNIFLARVEGSDEPVAKVLDFGIAKSIEGDASLNQFETMDGTVFGTPRYMSPEQAQGKALDHRSDLYAVGIVLYELLVGSPPFVDRDAVIVMAKHIREQPAPLASAAPTQTFPSSLQRVLDKALQKSPEDRYQSASEFEHALDRCLRYAELLERVPSGGRRAVASALAAPTWTRFALGAVVLLAFFVLASRSIVSETAVRRERELAPLRTESAIAAAEAQAPAAPATSGASAPAKEPEMRMVTLASEPRGANVWNEGRFMGTTPLPVEVPVGKSVRVRLSLAGYENQTLDLGPEEGARSVRLERSIAARPVTTETATVSQRERSRGARKPKRTAPAAPEPTPGSEGTPQVYEKF